MVVNWFEIGLLVTLNAAILAAFALIGFRWARKKLLPAAEQWMGGAIGRFMHQLTEQAVEEGSQEETILKAGGFSLNPGTIKSILELVKMAQELGFLKTGGTSGTFGLK